MDYSYVLFDPWGHKIADAPSRSDRERLVDEHLRKTDHAFVRSVCNHGGKEEYHRKAVSLEDSVEYRLEDPKRSGIAKVVGRTFMDTTRFSGQYVYLLSDRTWVTANDLLLVMK